MSILQDITQLKVNKNIIFSKLRNEKKYILIKKEKEYYPMFLKEKYIDILYLIKNKEHINNIKCSMINSDDLQLLIDCNILVNDADKSKDISYDCCDKKYIDELNKLAVITRTPIMCKIEITYNCNYKCDYCYVENLKSIFMKYEDLEKIIYKLKINGTNNLFITGGEPFLHPNIYQIIDYCDKIGIILTIQTNGSFINEEVIRKLYKYNHLKIAISFHSSIEEKFDSFTKVKGSFQRTIKAINYLKKYNMDFYLKHTVTRENEKDLKGNIKYLEDNDIPFNIYSQILPSISEYKDTSCYSATTESIEWLYKHKYLKYIKGACSALKNKCWISPIGDFYPCELVRDKIGNLIEDDFEELWNGDKANKVLKSEIYIEPRQCKSCNTKEYCKKCLAYLNYNQWNLGLNSFCNTAKIVKKIYSNNAI